MRRELPVLSAFFLVLLMVVSPLSAGAASAAATPEADAPDLSSPVARLVGKPAPDFALPDLKGRVWRLSDLRARKLVAVQFASTSCHCGQLALLDLDMLQSSLEKRGLQALAIGFEASPLRPPVEFVREMRLAVPFLNDQGLKTAAVYGARWPPCVIVVDRMGIIRWARDVFRGDGDVFRQTEAAVRRLIAADETWGQNSAYGRLYASGNPTVITGVVKSKQQVAPMKGMSPGVALTLTAESSVHHVQLGPVWYVDSQPVRIVAKDVVTVIGTTVRLGGKPVILAREIRRGGQVMKLRDARGRPLWSISSSDVSRVTQ
jgi:peroxiredoxin